MTDKALTGVVAMQSREDGFTLIELMIVVAIISMLASLGIPIYQDYAIRAQVTEGVNLSTHAKAPIAEAFLNSGEAPTNRTEAGLTPNPTDTQGKYVASVDINNGVVIVTFGNEANAQIAGLTFTLTPYETNNLGVVWRCGTAPAAVGLTLMGTSGGGNAAVYVAPTVPPQYMPASCRA
jgi:type IV pilus assembly protein PilA